MSIELELKKTSISSIQTAFFCNFGEMTLNSIMVQCFAKYIKHYLQFVNTNRTSFLLGCYSQVTLEETTVNSFDHVACVSHPPLLYSMTPPNKESTCADDDLALRMCWDRKQCITWHIPLLLRTVDFLRCADRFGQKFRTSVVEWVGYFLS